MFDTLMDRLGVSGAAADPEQSQSSSSESENLDEGPFQPLLEAVKDTLQVYLPEHQVRLVREMQEEHYLRRDPEPSRLVEQLVLWTLQERLQQDYPQATVSQRLNAKGEVSDGFPDVQVRVDGEVVCGIEVKSYDVLCRERMPTPRFQVSQSACAPQDLLVIVPWLWEFVWPGTGRPTLLSGAFVESCHSVIKSRNHAWKWRGRPMAEQQGLRAQQTGVRERINVDTKGADQGKNFGRVGRIPIVKAWTDEVMASYYSPKGHPLKQQVAVLWALLWGDLLDTLNTHPSSD